MTALLIALGIIWYAIGVVSLFIDWSRRYDVTAEDLCMFLMCGFIGPIAIIFLLDGIVIFKRRGR